MTFQENRTAEELVFEINRLDKAMPILYSAESITVCAAKYEHGQKIKTEECSLNRAELVGVVCPALSRRQYELLDQLRESHPEDFVALAKQTGSKIDPKTAEIIWGYENRVDPYGIAPKAADGSRETLFYVYAPRSKIWVWIGDLPNQTRQALRLRLAKEAAPAWWLPETSKHVAAQLQSFES